MQGSDQIAAPYNPLLTVYHATSLTFGRKSEHAERNIKLHLSFATLSHTQLKRRSDSTKR